MCNYHCTFYFLPLTHVCRYMWLLRTPIGKHMLQYKDTIPYTSISENNSRSNTDKRIHTNMDLCMAWNIATEGLHREAPHKVCNNYSPNFVRRWRCCEWQRRWVRRIRWEHQTADCLAGDSILRKIFPDNTYITHIYLLFLNIGSLDICSHILQLQFTNINYKIESIRFPQRISITQVCTIYDDDDCTYYL